MAYKNSETKINFLAEKVYVHHWPKNTTSWSDLFAEDIDLHLNKNKEKKKIQIKDSSIHIDNYRIEGIKKIGVTIPLFKKETTMVFEGKIQDFSAHIHITTLSKNYLEIFNILMRWKNRLFPN